jgi:hypothetical protein
MALRRTIMTINASTDDVIRALDDAELDLVAGGSPLDVVVKLWNAGTAIPAQCEKDPTGQGTTIGNCMYF